MDEAKVKDIMSQNPITVSPNDTLMTAGNLFMDHSIHHIPVVDEGKLVGIISNVDYERSKYGKSFFVNHNVDAHNATILKTTLVGMIMTKKVATISPDVDLKSAYLTLKSKSFRSLPVVKDEILVGIITTMDFLDHIYK